jgi:hypothetical protein
MVPKIIIAGLPTAAARVLDQVYHVGFVVDKEAL